MKPEYVDWDDPDDPEGNVWHIEAADLTTRDVEDVLDEPDGPVEPDENAPDETVRHIAFGWTATGRHIVVVFEISCDDPFIVRPITAFDVPEYGAGD